MNKIALILLLAIFAVSCESSIIIVTSDNAFYQEDLAAKELHRYIYQRTGELSKIVPYKGADLATNAVIIATRGTSFYNEICPDDIKAEVNGLKPEGHIVKTVARGQDRRHYIIGADNIGTLYGSYVFAENMGVVFTLNEDGTVKYSYPAKYASTLNQYSGYRPWPANNFVGGADRIFKTDDFGSEITDGFRPEPTTVSQSNQLFNRAGAFYNRAFQYGKVLGLSYCLGTEIPLKLPEALRTYLIKKGLDPDADEVIRDIYKGTFKRITKTHPLEYYWLWTGETWQWNTPSKEEEIKVVKNFKLAQDALDELNNPFHLASAGWVLGPPDNRSVFDNILEADAAMSAISRFLGSHVVDRGFENVTNRPKWAIPWLEDDVAMTTPQFWAGRMRRDAADALNYECTGLIGLHWRTKQLAPNIMSLAHAGWDQKEWNPYFGEKMFFSKDSTNVSYGGQNRSANDSIAGANDSEIYKTAREGVREYNVGMPNGKYTVKLHFCEYEKTGKGKTSTPNGPGPCSAKMFQEN